MKDKIIARIRKMMAISADEGASEGERDNAMRMVHAYLVKHNLSSSEIVEKKEERVNDPMEVKNGAPWKRTCMNGIAQLFFCHYFYIPAKGNRLEKSCFVGLESNTVTAKEMSTYIVGSIYKEGWKRKHALNESTSYLRGFFFGAAEQIYRRCEELKAKSMEPSKETGTGLVVASHYESEKLENAKFLKEVMRIKLSPSKSRRTGLDSSGYDAGMNFGNTIPLNTQVK